MGLSANNYPNIVGELRKAAEYILKDREKYLKLSQEDFEKLWLLKASPAINKFVKEQPYIYTQEEIAKNTKQNLERFRRFVDSSIKQQITDPDYVIEKYNNIKEKWLKEAFAILTDGVPVSPENKDKLTHELSESVIRIAQELLRDNKSLSPGDRETLKFNIRLQVKNFMEQPGSATSATKNISTPAAPKEALGK